MFGVNPDKVLTDKGTEHDLNVMVHFANQLNGIKHKVHCVQNALCHYKTISSGGMLY